MLERLESTENMAAVRIQSELPTLVELVAAAGQGQASRAAALERFVGPPRNEWVYFQPRELATRTEMEWPALARTLRELSELASVDYIPAFRGRAIHMPDRSRPFSASRSISRPAKSARRPNTSGLATVVRYAQTRNCRQQEILRYFGEQNSAACRHCDNCGPTEQAAAPNRLPPPMSRRAGSRADRAQRGRPAMAAAAKAAGPDALRLDSEKVTRNRLNRLSTYGLLGHLQQNEVVELIDALVSARCIEQVDIDASGPCSS